MNARHQEREAQTPRIHLASLGCAKNLIDSERLLARLALSGAMVGAQAEEADVILVNTCGFIASAREESLGVIRAYAELKRQDPDLRVIVLGCLAERDGEGLRRQMPQIDGVFGLDADEAIVAACGLEPADEEARLLLTPGHTAYLRISEGCDNACTYCTIPSIRGPFRSRPAEDIVREAQDLVAGGVRELSLIGQDTTSFGRDLRPPTSIDRLLRAVAVIENLRWLRLLYAYPDRITDKLISTFRDLKVLCPYIDLPLQHLDSEVLRRMGRGMTYEETARLVERLRREIPGLILRTTFIVGFPGETEAQFERLLEGIEELRFDHVGVFGYSREEGTPAAAFADQVSQDEIDRRVEEAMLCQQAIAFRANEALIGTTVEVLVDAPGTEAGIWIGRTTAQAPDVDSITILRGAKLEPGQFIQAQIVGMDAYDLIADSLS